MNAPAKTFQVSQHVEGIVRHVFDTMLALQPTPGPPGALPSARVSGTIGIAGEHVIGTVYIHLPDLLARAVASLMLQCPPDAPASDGDTNDVLSELTNMIGCRLKSLLNDADVSCAISTPSVIRGAFAVEAPPGVRAEKFYFTCLDQRLAVEVHLKLN